MPATPPSSRLMRFAVLGSALLLILALIAFWYASEHARQRPGPSADQTITVTIQGKACTPNAITVPAGPTTFTIVNQSERVLEWEILDGVMVVEERENIAPGFTQTMTANLQPGTYEITCGLLSNPRGTLTVTPSSTSKAEAAHPPLVNYIGALAEYKVFLTLGADKFEQSVQALSTAIQANDLEHARALYAPAQTAYARIEAMASRFADLDARINAPAQYFEKREADPEFVGLQRIAYGLFSQGSLSGLAPIAQTLQQDADTLKTRLHDMKLQPALLADSATKLLQREARALANPEEISLPGATETLRSRVEGAKKSADLLAPLITKAAPDLQQALSDDFAALANKLPPITDGALPAPLDAAQAKALATLVDSTAQDLGRINSALGIE
ncbi:MAG: cupredoxin domain-containing protein [Alcaligenaceae bacterium]|nr:cupredoxin domain-containing protein [Alcaligenaceae bacterium]